MSPLQVLGIAEASQKVNSVSGIALGNFLGPNWAFRYLSLGTAIGMSPGDLSCLLRTHCSLVWHLLEQCLQFVELQNRKDRRRFSGIRDVSPQLLFNLTGDLLHKLGRPVNRNWYQQCLFCPLHGGQEYTA